MEQTTELYSGIDGKNYLDQRQGATSAHNQRLRASLYADLGGADRTILDFGCGTGGVLARVEAKNRIGIEIGQEAAAEARNAGIETHASLAEVASDSVDVAISFHAIEHVDHPAEILRQLGRVVRPGGRMRLIVPGELATERFQATWTLNRDKHLYTWTPLLFGNLAHHCGLEDIFTHVAPMPTGSRLVRMTRILPPLSKSVHKFLARKRNALNVILDAKAPS